MSSLSPPATLSYHVTATDVMDQTSREPVSGERVITLNETDLAPLFINEFMADNENVISDEAGEFDDWFEIFNAGNESEFLGDKYLSDNFQRPDKFRMPDEWIGPGEIILFWADEDQDQGIFHTNFKLSKEGEEIGIFYGEEFGFIPIHSFEFGPQQQDESMGFLPDGTEPLQILPFATPGRSNVVTGIQDEIFSKVKIFPNPFSDQVTIISEEWLTGTEIWIFGSTGRLMMREALDRQQTILNLESLPPGLYFIHLRGEEGSFSHRLLKR
jgi:hypothetical protein